MVIDPETIEKAKQRRLLKLEAEDRKAGLLPKHPGERKEGGQVEGAVDRNEFENLARRVHDQHMLIEAMIVLMRLSGAFDNDDVRRVFSLVDEFDGTVAPKSKFESSVEWVEARYWWILEKLGGE